jgi:signal transduction protein with GAF and PtsI domain
MFSSAVKEIVATLDLERTLGHIVGTAAATMPADSGLVFLQGKAEECYQVRASYLLPLPDEQIDEISFAPGEGVPGWVVTEGQPLIIVDAQVDERCIRSSSKRVCNPC